MPRQAQQPKRDFNFRAFVTFLTAVAFLIMTVSGVVLYLAPRGRVANWTQWTVAWLDKEQWSDLHMAAAGLLLIAIAFHLYFNFKPLCHYLKSKVANHRARLRELTAAVIICLLLAVGSIFELPPVSLVAAVNERIKDTWETTTPTRAPSTYVQQATVAQFARDMNVPLDQLQNVLRDMGIDNPDPHARMDALAREYNIPLQTIADALHQPAARQHFPDNDQAQRGSGAGRAVNAQPRMGQTTLAQHCQSHDLDLETTLAALHARNAHATADSRLRDIADQLDITPQMLVESLNTPN